MRFIAIVAILFAEMAFGDRLPPDDHRFVDATNGHLEVRFVLGLESGGRVRFECRDQKPVVRSSGGRDYAIVTRLDVADGKVTASIDGRDDVVVCDCAASTSLVCRLVAFGLGTGKTRYAYHVTGGDGIEHVVRGGSYEAQGRGIGWFGFETPGSPAKRFTLGDVTWKVRERADPSAVWSFEELSKVPAYRLCPAKESEWEDLRSLLVKGKGPKGSDAEFFCYYGVPKGKMPAGGWPGVVLVHGGGGTAYPNYVQQWNELGFAVIAPDWYNRRPAPGLTNVPPTQVSVPRVDLAGGKRQDNVANVANFILAHSLLRSFPEVNKDRTVYVGLSWGSWYGTCVAAIDDRFRGCVEIYCGDYRPDKGGSYRFVEGRFLPEAKVPMHWTVLTNDRNVTPYTSNDGFEACARFDGVSLMNSAAHSHVGFEFDSVHRMARHYTGDAKCLPKLGEPRVEKGRVLARILDRGEGIAFAKICYTCMTDEKTYQRKWMSQPAEIAGDVVSAVLPDGAVQCYLAVYEKKSSRMDLCGATRFVNLK